MKLRNVLNVGIAVVFAATMMMGIGSADAAKGGAKLGGFSAPKVTAPAPKATAPSGGTATKKADSPNTKEYAPSKAASEHSATAPKAQQAPGAVNPAANTGTRWGNMLRGMGFFAGGMLLGSMLSHMLGMGGGFLGDLLGVLANVVIVFLVYKLIRFGISAIFNRKKNNGGFDNTSPYNPYSSNSQDDGRMNATQMDVRDAAPWNQASQSRGGNDYDPKSTADRYRRM